MKSKVAVVCFGLSAALTTVLFGAEGIKQPVEVTQTQRFDFAPGGSIRMIGGYGHLNVEGWDQPAVEIRVNQSMGPDSRPDQLERVKQRLGRIQVVAERRSDKEMVISTILPRRAHFSPPLSRTTRDGVQLDYDIHVPRDAHVVIRHGKGYVSLANVTGDIEASARSGDIVLLLPQSGTFAIDARCGIGSVVSENGGIAHRKYLLGERLDAAAGSHKIRLRVAFGGITIQRALPESE